MLPCVLVPDLAGFDWPAARLPESYLQTEHEQELPEGGPPAELFSNWTTRCVGRLCRVAVVSIPPDDDARRSGRCRSLGFDWPTGGTEEFLGRRAARPDSRRTEAKGASADPPNVFGAVGRSATPGVVAPDRAGNHKDRTSRCSRGAVTLVARGNRSKTAVGQVGNSGVRALILVSINVFQVRDHVFALRIREHDT
jgi:hypothetical protein